MSRSQRSVGVAYFLMLFSFIGVCGIQHFYMGKIFRGVIWFATLGLFGVGLLVDIFTIPAQVSKVNRGY